MRGRELFKKNKKIIFYICKCVGILPNKIRNFLFELFRNTKGKKGILIRYILLKTLTKECGENVAIYSGVYMFNLQNISIGNNVSIHPMCYIDPSKEANIKIGNDVSIAHSVTILGFNHEYSNIDIPIKDQGIKGKDTIIGNNIWIGAKATILSGKTIENGAIIAANCVVSKNIKTNTIVGGIPNQVLKVRN